MKIKTSFRQVSIIIGIIFFLMGAVSLFQNYVLHKIDGFVPAKAKEHHKTTIPTFPNSNKKVPAEWIELIHKAAPGDDWRDIESRSVRQLLLNKQSGKSSALSGKWTERGPSNIPGRIIDMEIDYATNTMYAISDHGIVLKAQNLEGSNWKAQNDQFPLGLDVATQLEIFGDGDMVTSGWIKVDNYWGIYHSTDDGISWKKSTGLSGNQIMGIKRMLKSNDEVYVFLQENYPQGNTDYYKILKSTNRGKTFTTLYQSKIPVGDGGRHRQSDMWVSNDTNNPDLYLALEDSLFIVNKSTGSRTFSSKISNMPSEQSLLTGLTKDGATELIAYNGFEGVGKFYKWSTKDPVWRPTGQLTDWWLALPFGFNSFTCSTESADVLYFGGLLTSKSTDGGNTWTTMDLDPTGSYALYHGDVPKVFTTLHPSTNKEDVYLGTDGGIYKMDNNEHFNSISTPGLNNTQIYKMVSDHASPGTMYIGTQDNGYSHTNQGNNQSESVPFTFQWGGDVTNVETSDGGKTFWLWWLGDGCNYMKGTDQTYSNWSPYDFNGRIPYWEAPICIPKQFPDRCYTAGYLNNNDDGNFIIELQANENSVASSTQLDFNFLKEIGGKISAISISPLDANYFYVTTENGFFCSSTDGGKTWKKTLLAPFTYPKVIYPSSINKGEVWVGGSGYSNSPVFYTKNNGVSFSNFNANLPACRIEAFATNEDESIIFAATSIGPFAYQNSESSWSDISGTSAPLVQYMDVEYIPSINTARFATYARGIWDFKITSISKTKDVTNNTVTVYPNPTSDLIHIQIDHHLLKNEYTIIDVKGKIIQKGKFDNTNVTISLRDFNAGKYFITSPSKTFPPIRIVKI